MLVTHDHVFAGTLGHGFYVYDRESERWFAIEQGLPSLQRDSVRRCEWLSVCWHGQRSGAHTRTEAAPMKRAILTILALAARIAPSSRGCWHLDSADKAQPDSGSLSGGDEHYHSHRQRGCARVRAADFANHTGEIEEGNYIFALPQPGPTVSDFAVWDGPTRIPAVVLERKRAEEVYTQLKRQAIDPGLLQNGRTRIGGSQTRSVFSARIVPFRRMEPSVWSSNITSPSRRNR